MVGLMHQSNVVEFLELFKSFYYLFYFNDFKLNFLNYVIYSIFLTKYS
jgi:hypothetical protein